MNVSDVLVNQILEINNSIRDLVNILSNSSLSTNSDLVYLDFGGALAAFGLIFTVYQLRKPEWDIVLRIRHVWQRYFFIFLAILALIFVFIRSLPHVENKLVWEILAYVFFVMSPLSLMYFAEKTRNLFNRKTSRRFYQILLSEVSRSDERALNGTLRVVLLNFDTICKSIRNCPLDSEINKTARAIIDVILSEQNVVKVLTTKRLDALQHIFFTIDKYGIHRSQCDVGISAIARNLFIDEESFLYKHLKRTGLALSSNIYPSIFGSTTILTNFNLFGYPTLGYSGKEDISYNNVSVLIEALSKTMETYFTTGDVSVRYINEGLKYLSGIFGNLCRKISIEANRGIDTKYELQDEWSILAKIASFLGHDYPFLIYQETLDANTVQREESASIANFYSGASVNEGMAAILSESFSQLSYIENTTDIYHIVHDLLHGMIFEENLKKGYRDPFEKEIWKQIKSNVINGYYPASLRSYLIYLGFCLVAGEEQRRGWVGEQAERMRKLLYIDLKPLLDQDKKMADGTLMKVALLPNLMSYEGGKFTYTMEFGRGRTVIIDEPVQGSVSAFDTVNN